MNKSTIGDMVKEVGHSMCIMIFVSNSIFKNIGMILRFFKDNIQSDTIKRKHSKNSDKEGEGVDGSFSSSHSYEIKETSTQKFSKR